jgi:predicted transposase YbfD/YdcC
VAIPKLLDMLSIEGAIVTIDAMGCQRDIARKILDKKAEYVLALKDNQATLREDVEVFVAEQKANGFQHTTISRGRWRSHRNARDNGHPRCRLAPGASRLAGPEERRHGRQRAGQR